MTEYKNNDGFAWKKQLVTQEEQDKFDKHCKDSWFRGQLSNIEDIIFDFECAKIDTDKVMYKMGIELGYLKRKLQDKYIDQNDWELYEEEWNEGMKHILLLDKIKNK